VGLTTVVCEHKEVEDSNNFGGAWLKKNKQIYVLSITIHAKSNF